MLLKIAGAKIVFFSFAYTSPRFLRLSLLKLRQQAAPQHSTKKRSGAERPTSYIIYIDISLFNNGTHCSAVIAVAPSQANLAGIESKALARCSVTQRR